MKNKRGLFTKHHVYTAYACIYADDRSLVLLVCYRRPTTFIATRPNKLNVSRPPIRLQ